MKTWILFGCIAVLAFAATLQKPQKRYEALAIPAVWDSVVEDIPLVDAGLIFNRHKHQPSQPSQPTQGYTSGQELNGYTCCVVNDTVTWVDAKGSHRWVMTNNGWHWTRCGKCGNPACTCGDACPGEGCQCGLAAAPVCANGQCGVFGRRRR